MWQMRLLLFSWGSCLEGSGALAFVERAGEGILDDVVKTVALTNQTVSYCCHSCYIYMETTLQDMSLTSVAWVFFS